MLGEGKAGEKGREKRRREGMEGRQEKEWDEI